MARNPNEPGSNSREKSMLLAVIAAALLSLIIAVLATLGLHFGLPVLGYRHLSANTLVTASLSIAAGIGAAVFMVVNYRKQSLAERTARVADETRLQRRIDELEVRFNDYAQALSGTPIQASAALRGVTLTSDQLSELDIARASEYYQRAVDVICSYIRYQGDNKSTHSASGQTIALEILRQKAKHTITHNWCGCSYNLRNVQLFTTLDISDCAFNGRLDLNKCIIYGDLEASQSTFHYLDVNDLGVSGNGNFEDAKFDTFLAEKGFRFEGNLDFTSAVFARSTVLGSPNYYRTDDLDLSNYSLVVAGEAIFNKAQFKGEVTAFEGATFVQMADFSNAKFRKLSLEDIYAQGNLLFEDCEFESVTIANSDVAWSLQFGGVLTGNRFDLSNVSCHRSLVLDQLVSAQSAEHSITIRADDVQPPNVVRLPNNVRLTGNSAQALMHAQNCK